MAITRRLSWRLFGAVVAILLAGGAKAQNCSILEQQPLDDMDGGWSGYCSNNGQRITCTYTSGDGWTCEGSQGTYTGIGALQQLIDQACGCSNTDIEE